MTTDLEELKDIGKSASALKEAGIDTVEKLAESNIDDLIKIKGIGEARAKKLIQSAKNFLGESDKSKETVDDSKDDSEKENKEDEELKAKLEEKRKRLEGKPVEEGDFLLVKITGRTEKGKVFRVSSEEDAKKAGIYDERKAAQGYYKPELVIAGKDGFVIEGLKEVIMGMKYFEKKSVRIPPSKAYGKRDPQKIERIGIAKFRKLNNGENPKIGQSFQSKKFGEGVVTNIVQGKVIVDYNHPLAGQHLDYIIEIVDKIEDFYEKIKYLMINKGIPENSVDDFKINYNEDDKSIEFIVPKQFIFQPLGYVKFALAYDLQTYMPDEIGDVKFVEIFEKIAFPTKTEDSVMKKVEEFNKESNSETKGSEKEENSKDEKNKK
ncbi:MAG: helix-hairpin-helix domain-containing protein [Promethearchaeota archaeon]